MKKFNSTYRIERFDLEKIETNKILLQALTLGFDFENAGDKRDIGDELLEFFMELDELDNIKGAKNKIQYYSDECEVSSNSRGQHVEHYYYSASGDIVDYFPDKKPEQRVWHSNYLCIIDGLVCRMNLYTY